MLRAGLNCSPPCDLSQTLTGTSAISPRPDEGSGFWVLGSGCRSQLAFNLLVSRVGFLTFAAEKRRRRLPSCSLPVTRTQTRVTPEAGVRSVNRQLPGCSAHCAPARQPVPLVITASWLGSLNIHPPSAGSCSSSAKPATLFFIKRFSFLCSFIHV